MRRDCSLNVSIRHLLDDRLCVTAQNATRLLEQRLDTAPGGAYSTTGSPKERCYNVGVALALRHLGASDLDVSVMSLGSWRTYERIPREQALAVMRAAREAGINFLDDARYDDETGTAPIPSGYSEVVFGE